MEKIRFSGHEGPCNGTNGKDGAARTLQAPSCYRFCFVRLFHVALPRRSVCDIESAGKLIAMPHAVPLSGVARMERSEIRGRCSRIPLRSMRASELQFPMAK